MPTDIATRPTGKVHRRPLKVLWAPPSSGRDPGVNTRQPLRIIQQRRVHLRLNVPRRNGIHRDAPGSPLIRKALGKLPNSALGGRVRGNSQPALKRQQRCEIDDTAAAARRG